MEVGISSAVFYPMLLEKSIDRIAEMGFKKVEIFFNCDSEVSPEYLKELKRKLSGYGITVISMHPYSSISEGICFFSNYARRTEENIERYKRYFEAAQLLGAKYFTFHGDRNVGKIEFDSRDCKPTEAQCETVMRLARACRECGVTLCIENVSWCKSSNLGYLRAMSDSLGKDIGFTLDMKQARRSGADIIDYLKVMGSKLKNVHVSDFEGQSLCLLPGEGQEDFKKFLNHLLEIHYAGDLIIEIYSSNFDNIRQIGDAKRYLECEIRSNWKFLGGYMSN